MKTKRYMRVISFILTLIMLVGMLPLSSIVSFADSIDYADNPYWVSVGASGLTNDEMFAGSNGLVELLSDNRGSGNGYNDGTMYIRLEKDIKVEFVRAEYGDESNGGYMNVPVYGNKVLDLNGHTIKSKMMLADIDKYDKYEGSERYSGVFLLVYGNLTIVDSKGGGEMMSDMQIQSTRPRQCYYYDLFHVMDGGELTINAPDADFTSGRSQKYYEDDISIRDLSYRSQSNGTAVDVHSGGKLTVVSGTLRGRGYEYNGTYRNWRCAAIVARENSSVYIIDGYFFGKGGADALNISDKAEITVESGTFDVFKVDRLVWYSGQRLPDISDGVYGYIGLPERVKTQLSPKGIAVEVVKNSHDVTGDELDENSTYIDNSQTKIIVRPTSGSSNLDDRRVSIASENDCYFINPCYLSEDSSQTYIVNASYNIPYFSRTAAELSDANYRPRTKAIGKNSAEYYLTWSFTLRKSNGSKVAELANVTTPGTETSVSVDLVSSYGVSKWKKLDTGNYVVRCEVTECWKGEHTYKSTWKNDMQLNISDNALTNYLSTIEDFKLDFYVSHTQNIYYGDVQNLTFELDYSTLSALKKVKKFYSDSYGDFDIYTYYTIHSYNMLGNQDTTTPQPMENTQTLRVSSGTGPKVVIAYVFIPRFDDSTNEIIAYDTLYVKKNFLLLPTMQKCLDSDAETVGFHKPISLTHTSSYVKVDTAEDVWSEPLSTGTFSWQWYSAEFHDMGADVGIHGTVYSEYTVAAENSSYKLSRDGSYRLALTYTPYGGLSSEEFVSVPIDIYASNVQSLRLATLSGSETIRPTIDDLKASPLTLNLQEGSWGTIESVTLTMRGRPSTVSRSLPIEGTARFSNAARKTYYYFYLNDFESIQDAINDSCAGGEYVFRATIRGKDTYGYRYTTYSDEFTVTFEKEAEGYALMVNGQYLGKGWSTEEEAQAQVVPLFINSNTKDITLKAVYYPEDATYDPNTLEYNYDCYCYWDDRATFLTTQHIDYEGRTLDATIKRPGVDVISIRIGKVVTYFKICVPVTRLEFDMPNYQDYIGKAYSEVVPESVKLYSASGASTTGSFGNTNYWNELRLEGYEPYFMETGNIYDSSETVAANNLGKVYYQFHLSEHQCFPLEEVREGRYMVDLSKVQITVNRDGVSETLSAEARGAYMNWDKDFCDDSFYQPSTTLTGFKISEDLFVKDESATYIESVVINTTEPGVGDPINEGIKIYRGTGYEWEQLGCTCKAGNVASFSNVKTEKGKDIIFVYMSQVSKASAETAGDHYTDASNAKVDGKNAWYYDSFLNGKYENGTYFHELLLFTNEDPAADGKKYYFAPDASVTLNGKLLDIEDMVYYNTKDDRSSLSLNYFYDVGEVTTVSSINISGIKPRQGNSPADADEATLSATYDDGTKDNGKVEIRSLTWFVDANNNGVLDSGEAVNAKFRADGTYNAEKSTLWWDGTFLPGVEYSVRIEVGSDSKNLRFASDLAVDCGGGTPVFNTSNSFTVKFDADYLIRKISIKTAEGEDAATPAGRDPLNLANASVAYDIRSIGIFKHQDYSGATEDTNVHNFYAPSGNLIEENLTEGKYFYEFWITWKDKNYSLDKNAAVLVNGKEYGEGFAPDRNEIVIERSDYSLYCYYCFTTPGAANVGASVSGTAISFGTVTDDVIIQLIESGMSEVAYEAVVQGNSVSYSIPGVVAGTYTMKVMKQNHVTREYTITVENSDITQDVKIHLKGDINGDGKITMVDAMKANLHARGKTLLTGYELKCADVVGTDGKVTVADVMRINAHVKGKTSLW